MKYIIMADGKGTRWNNYMNIPKHLIKINGETIIGRTVRLLNKYDKGANVIVTSHDSRYEFDGATRYEPLNNVLEIDRFTYELIEDNICFLYGDTYYTEDAIKSIIESQTNKLLFFGNEKSIVAIKIANSRVFKNNIDRVKALYLEGKIKSCKGWQVYQSYRNLEFDKNIIDDEFIVVDNQTIDYNTPNEYEINNGRRRA